MTVHLVIHNPTGNVSLVAATRDLADQYCEHTTKANDYRIVAWRVAPFNLAGRPDRNI